MGVRVHKAIGFGVRPFQPPKNFYDKVNEASDLTLEEFATWCRAHEEEILTFVPETDRGRRMMFMNVDLTPITQKHFQEPLGSCIDYEAEFGLKDAILLRPIANDGWSRYDDMLDWAEETHSHKTKNRFKFLDIGLYPHDKGKPPLTVAAILLWLGLEKLWPKLREALYVHWG